MVRARLAGLLLLLLLPASALADRVVLKNGSVFRGRVLSEDRTEIELELEDGMTIRIRRARIESVEREEAPEESPEQATDVVPPTVDAEPGPKDPDPGAGPAVDPGLFSGDPNGDWFRRYGRYPVLTAARTAGFRAYEHVSHAPLDLSKADPALWKLVREHGHGGFLATWTFQYVGMRDLRFGDEVRFVGELTSPSSGAPGLLRLKQGPEPTTDRMVVFLVKRGSQIRRHATTTRFAGADFRQADLNAIDPKSLPVRTYDAGFRLRKTTWLSPSRGDFLRDLQTTFGESIRQKLMRYRFRVRWLSTPPAKRPALDPDLVARNVLRPLAVEGRPAATEEGVLRVWGSLEANLRVLDDLVAEVAARLAEIGIDGGGDHCVERERVGVFGALGPTIRTERFFLSRELIEDVLRR